MKDKRYYYECVTTCQMGYMAPSTRLEERREDGVPPMVLHERQFNPRGAMGKKEPDYLCTAAPISRRYTEEVARNFKKRDFRTGEMKDIEAHSVIKFVLLESDEVDAGIRRVARFMTLREIDTAVADKELASASA